MRAFAQATPSLRRDKRQRTWAQKPTNLSRHKR